MKRGELTFTANEQAGYTLFKAKCTSCHAEPLFTDLNYRNNGLSMNASLKDRGRMRITGDRKDSLKFKVPSLRNVAVSAPYMHDGRFFDLYTVLNHYSNGINNSPTLDAQLTNKIPLTILEKEYLVIFLQTLTDSAFIHNKQFEQTR
jgi:cytochrome c peroxidase